jgi:hypothetical protein
LINVCYDLEGPTTRQREIRGLKEAMEYFDCETSILITRDEEETIAENGKTVSIIPLWKWLPAGGE